MRAEPTRFKNKPFPRRHAVEGTSVTWCHAVPSKSRLVAERTFKVICVYLRQAHAQRAPHLRASASQSVSAVALPANQDHGDSSLDGGKPGRATD